MEYNYRYAAYNSGVRGGSNNSVHRTGPSAGRSGYSQRDVQEPGRRTSEDSKRPHKKNPGRIAFTIIFDVFVSAVILFVFYITNYVVEPKITGEALPTPAGYSAKSESVISDKTEAAGESVTAAASESAEPGAVAEVDSWREKFADKFTEGEVVKTDSSYKSANINVNVQKYEDNGVVYFVTDIYLADIKYLKTAFAKDADVLGARENVKAIAEENNAVIAINGDLCLDNKGFVIRNGVSYETDKSAADTMVMYNDGSMQTYAADQMDRDAVISKGVYQVWTFGPMLLDNGQPMTSFNTTQSINGPNNPRTAIGYYEPGHYCFVTVDGRQEGYSYPGYSLEQMSQLMYKLNCQMAYNLDGGQSTELVYKYDGGYDFVNKPYNGGRSTSDIVYITDEG